MPGVDAIRIVKIDATKDLPMALEPVQTLLRGVDALHAAVPLKEFSVMFDVDHYVYHIETKYGRVWGQWLRTEPPAAMTFNVPDYWRLDEFVPHRLVRDTVFLLIQHFFVTHIRITYPAST